MQDYYAEPLSNPSTAPSIADLISTGVSRRRLLQGGLLTAALTFLRSPLAPASSGLAAATTAPLFSFQGIPVSQADTVVVPPGYQATVLYAWGDPISQGPAFKAEAGNTAAEQALQAGMHHDGMHVFPLPRGTQNSTHGLLVVNHEYTDDGLLHTDGMEAWSAEKVAKSQAAHGVSVVEIALQDGRWSVVRPSQYARRITSRTPFRLSGAAAGHALLQTADDPQGRRVLGTVNNCAHGVTPWGTYLTCEENFHGYFVNARGDIEGHSDPEQKQRLLNMQKRYGIRATGAGYRWHEHDARFDAARHPHEPHRFGWVAEIDPFEPQSEPVKHTALGRFKHEGATITLSPSNHVVVYMGDDERNEYVYKFVSAGTYIPADPAANRRLLEQGTLYVARFNADGSGVWLPLVHGQHGLDAAAGFADQAEVLTYARAAADTLGATPMDRPEWIAIHPTTQEVYCTLTNNSNRGTEKGPATDAANPRARNVYGHIIRWREQDTNPQATRFTWDIFLLCGDPTMAEAEKQGTIRGDVFGSPDGLWFDQRGVLWIQTDVSTSVLNKGDYTHLGNNQMLAADPSTGEVRRFLTGPRGCEITGVVTTPDGKSMFVNIQHPGETASERSDPKNPTAVSAWPDGKDRPRAATVVIHKTDGGVIGS
ncbi:MAG: PhoX family phosphatase [Candidatus Tectimicrobiota bacterium]